MRFQKIPYKERMRQTRYRQEHEDKLEDRRIEKEIRRMEALKRQQAGEPISEKEREMVEALLRLGKIER